MDTSQIRPANELQDLETVRGQLLDCAARALIEPAHQAVPLLTEGLFRFSEISSPLLNASADSYTTLFVGIPRAAGGAASEETTLSHLPRPPTHMIKAVASVGRQDRVPEIHRTNFLATVCPAAFGALPHLPLELYEISGASPEAVFIWKLSDWYPRLQSFRYTDGKPRGCLVRALLHDAENGVVESLLALPLLCPWSVVSLGRSRRLLGHILITSSVPSPLLRSRYYLSGNMLAELDSVLSVFAELVAIFYDKDLRTVTR